MLSKYRKANNTSVRIIEVELSFIPSSVFLIFTFLDFLFLKLELGLSITLQDHRSYIIIESSKILWKK